MRPEMSLGSTFVLESHLSSDHQKTRGHVLYAARAPAGWEADGPPACAPARPELLTDWRGSIQKAAILGTSCGVTRRNSAPATKRREASSDFDPPCFAEVLGDVSLKSGVQLRPLPFKTSPEVVPAPLGTTFMCVFNFCFKLCSSRICPMPVPSPLRSCGKGGFAWTQKRATGCSVAGPSTSTHGSLAGAMQPGMKSTPATCAEGPTGKLPDPRPHGWRLVVSEAQIRVAGCP